MKDSCQYHEGRANGGDPAEEDHLWKQSTMCRVSVSTTTQQAVLSSAPTEDDLAVVQAFRGVVSKNIMLHDMKLLQKVVFPQLSKLSGATKPQEDRSFEKFLRRLHLRVKELADSIRISVESAHALSLTDEEEVLLVDASEDPVTDPLAEISVDSHRVRDVHAPGLFMILQGYLQRVLQEALPMEDTHVAVFFDMLRIFSRPKVARLIGSGVIVKNGGADDEKQVVRALDLYNADVAREVSRGAVPEVAVSEEQARALIRQAAGGAGLVLSSAESNQNRLTMLRYLVLEMKTQILFLLAQHFRLRCTNHGDALELGTNCANSAEAAFLRMPFRDFRALNDVSRETQETSALPIVAVFGEEVDAENESRVSGRHEQQEPAPLRNQNAWTDFTLGDFLLGELLTSVVPDMGGEHLDLRELTDWDDEKQDFKSPDWRASVGFGGEGDKRAPEGLRRRCGWLADRLSSLVFDDHEAAMITM